MINLLQDKMEMDVDAYLRRLYESQIADIEIVDKEDLDLVSFVFPTWQSLLLFHVSNLVNALFWMWKLEGQINTIFLKSFYYGGQMMLDFQIKISIQDLNIMSLHERIDICERIPIMNKYTNWNSISLHW